MAGNDALLSPGPDALPMLQQLGELLEVGVLTLDRELVVRGWNRWLEAASGTPASAIVGRPLLDAFPELFGGAAETALRRALGGATTVWSQRFHQYLIPLPPPAGYDRYDRMQQSARIMPLLRDDAADGVLVLVQDVTERIAREQDLRDALHHAQSGSQAKSDFLASMTHELRTPLAAIVSYMDVLADEMAGPVAPLQKSYLGRVKSAARHLIDVIGEILTFSRIEAGKEETAPDVVDALAVARSVAELFEPQAIQKGVALTVATDSTSAMLGTDPTKLRQIIINLLGNAIKFTDAGEVTLRVAVVDDRVLFSVRDTGPGITAADLTRIFDPFTQVDQSLKRAKGGTGLGLPVSRRLARLLGGDLSVESAPGQGATFTLWLPLYVGVAGSKSPRPTHEPLLPQQ